MEVCEVFVMTSKNEWRLPLLMRKEETSRGVVVPSTAVDHFTFDLLQFLVFT